jgi:hypothetical protein
VDYCPNGYIGELKKSSKKAGKEYEILGNGS